MYRTQCTETAMSMLYCNSLPDGNSYLAADYDVQCWTGTHASYVVPGIIFALVSPSSFSAVNAANVLLQYRPTIPDCVLDRRSRACEQILLHCIRGKAHVLRSICGAYSDANKFRETNDAASAIAYGSFAIGFIFIC